MKKLLLITLTALLLLCACNQIPPQDYCNMPDGCILGNTQYSNPDAICIQQWNPAWEEPYRGLCRDPLCTHTSNDSLCPSSVYMEFTFQTIVTDGYKLYINTGNNLVDERDAMHRQIYSLNPDGSEFTLLHTFPVTSNTPTGLQYADGYLYFKQGVYDDNYDPQNTSFSDQIMKTMRIPTGGGEAEAVLGTESDTATTVYVDGKNYYLISRDDNNTPILDVINIKNGNKTENILPNVKNGQFVITVYAGKTWLTHTFSSENTDQFDPMGDLYVWQDNGFALICDDKFDYSFGGGIWYKERTERTHIGTIDAPTGGPGSETLPVDLYVEPTSMLCRLDPNDFSITEYVPSDDFDPEDTIRVNSTSESGIRAQVLNNRKKLAGEPDTYDCLIRCENGKIEIEKVYN